MLTGAYIIHARAPKFAHLRLHAEVREAMLSGDYHMPGTENCIMKLQETLTHISLKRLKDKASCEQAAYRSLSAHSQVPKHLQCSALTLTQAPGFDMQNFTGQLVIGASN